jgi:hypothetical protein
MSEIRYRLAMARNSDLEKIRALQVEHDVLRRLAEEPMRFFGME